MFATSFSIDVWLTYYILAMFIYVIISQNGICKKMREKKILEKIRVLQKNRNIWIKMLTKDNKGKKENEDKRIENYVHLKIIKIVINK